MLGQSLAALSLKGRALKHLAAREHSRAELRVKLLAHANADAVDALLDDLEAKDWLSDARAAAALVHRRAPKLGNARVVAELRARGVAAQAIEQATEPLAQDEFTRALAVWRKRFGGRGDAVSPVFDPAERARAQRFLMARGFGAEVVSRVLREASRPEGV
jgi:regulatory protein